MQRRKDWTLLCSMVSWGCLKEVEEEGKEEVMLQILEVELMGLCSCFKDLLVDQEEKVRARETLCRFFWALPSHISMLRGNLTLPFRTGMLQGQDRIKMITTFLTGPSVSSVILCSLARNQRRSLSLVEMIILTLALMRARRKMKGT